MEFDFVFSPELADNHLTDNIDLATEIADIDKILEEIANEGTAWLGL